MAKYTRTNLGRFYISPPYCDLLNDDAIETCEAIFKKIIPIYINREMLHISRKGILYVGISELFEEVAEGSQIPEYVLILDRTPTGKPRLAAVEKIEDNPESNEWVFNG